MIAILSDFGDSEYLGVMKAVIYDIDENAKIVDLYNKVSPQNIKEGAWILLNSYKYFKKGTIFLCVVDPGVGTKRKCIGIKTKDYFFVGPDNGLMFPAAKENGIKKVVNLPTKQASKTFHGRDVFAKAAVLLERGEKIESLGKEIKRIKGLNFYKLGRRGEIVRIDEFGNIITNLESLNKKRYKLIIKNKEMYIDFFKTYGEAPSDRLFLIKGSSGTLEISLKNDSAIKKLKVKVGDKIEIL